MASPLVELRLRRLHEQMSIVNEGWDAFDQAGAS